jgi:hypothetical protein
VDASGFEGGADDEGGARGGEGPGEEALRLARGDTEEVFQRGSAGDGEGGQLVLGKQLAGAFDAMSALDGGDGNGLVRTVFEGGDRVRKRGGSLGLGASACGINGKAWRGGGGGG